jgi:dihydroflavonol-4-reductase
MRPDPPLPSALRGAPVVVTGASGHLGSNLVPLLVAAGADVRVLTHRTGSRHPDVRAMQGAVQDLDSLQSAFRGARYVFHLAGRVSIQGDPGGEVTAVNVHGARNVARAARAEGVSRLVHVSSVHAFDHPQNGPLTESAARPTPRHPAYDRSKAAGEAAVREEAGDALEVVIANPTGILGPADHGPSRAGRMLLQLFHRQLPMLTPGGFDWVDARDVSTALMSMATAGRPGENYLLGGSWCSLVDLAQLASTITGVAAPRFVCPSWLARASAPFMAALYGALGQEPLYTSESVLAVLHGSRDVRSDKASAELGYRARALEDTLRDTYRFFEEAGMLRGRGSRG